MVPALKCAPGYVFGGVRKNGLLGLFLICLVAMEIFRCVCTFGLFVMSEKLYDFCGDITKIALFIILLKFFKESSKVLTIFISQ